MGGIEFIPGAKPTLMGTLRYIQLFVFIDV
jgi:hypothetical protein